MSESSGSTSSGTVAPKPQTTPETQAEETSGEETRDYYLAQDGVTGRDGGPYLDQVEREVAEVHRARAEDREPDLENPGPTAGTVLTTKPEHNPASNPSTAYQDTSTGTNPELQSLTLPVDTRTEAPEEDSAE